MGHLTKEIKKILSSEGFELGPSVSLSLVLVGTSLWSHRMRLAVVGSGPGVLSCCCFFSLT